MEHIRIENTDSYIIKVNQFNDERGYFIDFLRNNKITIDNKEFNFVQDNISKSNLGVLRGLHAQSKPFEQGKLLIVLNGKIQNVFIDYTKKEEKKYYSVILNSDSYDQRCIFIPPNYVNSFLVLSQSATILYKCTQEYSIHHEIGIHPFDPNFKIDWKIEHSKIQLSEKDKSRKFI